MQFCIIIANGALCLTYHLSWSSFSFAKGHCFSEWVSFALSCRGFACHDLMSSPFKRAARYVFIVVTTAPVQETTNITDDFTCYKCS